MVEHRLGKVAVGVLTTASITESATDLSRHGRQLPPAEHQAGIRRSPKGMLSFQMDFIIDLFANLNEFVDQSVAGGYVLGLALVCLLQFVLHVHRLFQGRRQNERYRRCEDRDIQARSRRAKPGREPSPCQAAAPSRKAA